MKLFKIVLIGVLIGAIVSACGGEAAPTEVPVDVLMTQGVATMVAAYFEAQTAMATPATNAPTSTQTPFPTMTPVSSPTPFSTPTYVYFTAAFGTLPFGTPTVTGTCATSTVNPTSLAHGCNNLAFIRDVTIPAGTVMQKGQNFTKTWKVQNTGTCPWMPQYRLELVSGSEFGAGPTKIQKQVAVNDWAEVSVNLDTPRQPGKYTSYWRMADSSGNRFGATLVVSFIVSESSPTPVPTTAVPTATPTETVTPTPTQ